MEAAASGNLQQERHPRNRMRRRVRNRAQIPAFGNWDYNDNNHHHQHYHHQQQVPITQYFDYCATNTTTTKPVLLHHSHASSVYPYAHSYSPAYTAYTAYGDDCHFHGDGSVYNHNYDAISQQPHFDSKTTNAVAAAEVKGAQTRQQRRRRTYLGVDNNSKVFDITEATPTPTPTFADKCYAHNDVVVVTSDLYDVGSSANVVTSEKDEDLYKIPPELLRKSKRTKKMRNFFTKCFVTICASY